MTFLRSLAYAVWFYGLTFVMVLASPALRMAPRRWNMAYVRVWARLMLSGLRVLCGITWEVSGFQHVPTHGPALIASMHQSAFDTIFWINLLPNVTYVLKRELTQIPLFGSLLRATGMIAVDRAGGGAAIHRLLRDGERAVEQGRAIVIFPEGTRATPGLPMPLQSGIAALAARTGLPVIPVATDSGLRWGRRSFRKREGVIHVAILPPLPTGLPREAVMRQLAGAFSEGTEMLRPSVDNSVGQPSPTLHRHNDSTD
jgi:1-acyl-sn-glycerol-3-phosphate acyltransferase